MPPLQRRQFLQQSAALGAAAMLGPVGGASAIGIDYDVIIIGAGMSGMTAARLLAEMGPGIKVLVLDARDRVGGRMYTSPDEISPHGVELGAQFIWGSKADTFELVSKYGMQTRSSQHFGETNFLYYRDGAAPAPRDEALQGALMGKLRKAYEAYQGPDMSLAAFASSNGISGGPEAELLATEAARWAAEADGLSLQAAIEDGAAWTQYRDEDFILFGGYSNLAEKMAADLSGKIRLESVVTDILWGEELCGVIYKDRGVESAVTSRRVIVTLPVGVLQSGDVKFQPPLPKAKQQALDSLAMGQAVVLPMLFSEPFWRDNIPYPGGLRRLDGQVSFTVPHDNKRGGNAINGYFTGDAARQMSSLGPEGALEQALSWLEQTTGVSGLQDKLTWHAVADWVADPYSYGCYSMTPPGGHGQREEFARQVGQTVFFAGEATEPAPHYQSVHGAYRSGKRVVREVASSLGLSDRLPGEEEATDGAVIEML